MYYEGDTTNTITMGRDMGWGGISSVKINSKLIVGNNNSYPDLQIGPNNGYNIGVATLAGSFSSSAQVGKMVIRSIETKRLILQANGGGAGALIIDNANNTSILGTLTVTGATTFNNSSTIFWYNTPGTSFTNNGFTSFLSLNSNVITNVWTVSQPFIRVYNIMWKNGGNTAIDLQTFGFSNSGVNSSVLMRMDSDGVLHQELMQEQNV
jgi:hypothetical protein